LLQIPKIPIFRGQLLGKGTALHAATVLERVKKIMRESLSLFRLSGLRVYLV
jgi:hypothetical protein